MIVWLIIIGWRFNCDGWTYRMNKENERLFRLCLFYVIKIIFHTHIHLRARDIDIDVAYRLYYRCKIDIWAIPRRYLNINEHLLLLLPQNSANYRTYPINITLKKTLRSIASINIKTACMYIRVYKKSKQEQSSLELFISRNI